MSEENGLTPNEMLEILTNTTQALHRQISQSIHLAARVDGLELVLVALGKKLGWPPEQLVAMTRKVQATCHQKRLERVEERNPAAAASADTRESMPDIDEALLKLMELDEPE